MGAMTHPLRALTFLPGVILTIMMFSLVNASAGVVIPNPSTPNQTIRPTPRSDLIPQAPAVGWQAVMRATTGNAAPWCSASKQTFKGPI